MHRSAVLLKGLKSKHRIHDQLDFILLFLFLWRQLARVILMGSLKGDSGHANGENLTEALLPTRDAQQQHQTDDEEQRFGDKLWFETRKLWLIVGPSIFSRLASFTMNVVTQAFAGHLGDVELAAISIANNVLVGFNFGLLVSLFLFPH